MSADFVERSGGRLVPVGKDWEELTDEDWSEWIRFRYNRPPEDRSNWHCWKRYADQLQEAFAKLKAQIVPEAVRELREANNPADRSRPTATTQEREA